MAIKYKYQMAGKWTKWPKNIPISSIARSSKIYPNCDFWFENIPSGNPASMMYGDHYLHSTDRNIFKKTSYCTF
jgi:hypothetical protein